MTEKKLDNYGKIAKILLVVAIVAAVLGVSYAIFRTTVRGEKTNEVRVGNVGLEIINESIDALTIDDKMVPMDESEALSSVTPYNFTLHNNGDYAMNYKLGFVLSDDTTMPAASVRYVLSKNGAEATSSIMGEVKPTYITNDDGTKTVVYYVDAGQLAADGSNTYELKAWIDYHAALEANDMKFSVKARADGEAVTNGSSEETLTTTSALLTPTDDQLGTFYDKKTKEITTADLAYDLTDGSSPISYYIGKQSGTMLVIPKGSTKYVYAFTKNAYGIEINKWYTTSDLSTFSEYSGSSPIAKGNYTTLYNEAYIDQIINSFTS